MGNSVPALKTYGWHEPARTTRSGVASAIERSRCGGCIFALDSGFNSCSRCSCWPHRLCARSTWWLRSGLRLKVTSYQLVGDKYRLQMTGGKLEIAAAEVVAIEPEDSFGRPATVQVSPQPLYRDLVEASR